MSDGYLIPAELFREATMRQRAPFGTRVIEPPQCPSCGFAVDRRGDLCETCTAKREMAIMANLSVAVNGGPVVVGGGGGGWAGLMNPNFMVVGLGDPFVVAGGGGAGSGPAQAAPARPAPKAKSPIARTTGRRRIALNDESP